jgi:hypothetical protein
MLNAVAIPRAFVPIYTVWRVLASSDKPFPFLLTVEAPISSRRWYLPTGLHCSRTKDRNMKNQFHEILTNCVPNSASLLPGAGVMVAESPLVWVKMCAPTPLWSEVHVYSYCISFFPHVYISRKFEGSRPDDVFESFFLIYLILSAALGPGVYSTSNRNDNMGSSASHHSLGLHDLLHG